MVLTQVAAEETSKTVTITCEEKYTMVGQDCYFISSETHSGSSAEQFCKKNGGNAAVIESSEELDLLIGKWTYISFCGVLQEKGMRRNMSSHSSRTLDMILVFTVVR